ncbi:MAG: acetolactate synthase small subunit [Tissierellales bacterium]|nr:acetolactate synthase small subunit [Tissierellales bacterium]MBN2826954.1 acetolactate synthase small subunit [Tissierellales bacterium]
MMKKERHVLSITVENYSGTLSKVAGLFTRRGYNIDTLNVAETMDPGISRITVTVTGDEEVLEQITKQLNKLINVIKIIDLTAKQSILREFMFLKINCNKENRSEIIQLATVFKGKTVDVAAKSITIEVTGDEEKNNAFIELMRPYGIIEIVRTGLTAIERG